MDNDLKQEITAPYESPEGVETLNLLKQTNVIDLDSEDSDSDSDSDVEGSPAKKQKVEIVLPVGFLDPLTPEERRSLFFEKEISSCRRPMQSSPSQKTPVAVTEKSLGTPVARSCKQFWKAGDYDGIKDNDYSSHIGGMDRVRVHPRFLHSNATSHKWALGAFAELLDNALDEVRNGATYVRVDMLENKKDSSKMLLIEDNGGGMAPEKMRQCMSLGYSAKSKLANTIGQYGNGFKTSTMRLGADAIVFSRSQGIDGRRSTQSIGMLSYTFLRGTGKEDIVVPMIDFEKVGERWNMLMPSSSDDWKKNLDTLVQWSPYASEEDLLSQFDFLNDQGTRIIIYNLWEDDQGELELDFDTDEHDIQIRGVNRDEKKIEMAKNYPNSRHFLTFQHSLRSYASILYLRIPQGFHIILRGEEVDNHNIVDDMMLIKEIKYKPIAIADNMPNESNMVADVTIGFVKDAKCHIDIQGFNVYHKNRLIKPFWRVWNAAGSDGRGVIGVLEANFVEPAHDKQGFERTTVLARLEARLIDMQKKYWTLNCHLVGYAPRRQQKSSSPLPKETSPAKLKSAGRSTAIHDRISKSRLESAGKVQRSSVDENANEDANSIAPARRTHRKASPAAGESHTHGASNGKTDKIAGCSPLKVEELNGTELIPDNSPAVMVERLKDENRELRERLEKLLQNLQYESDRSTVLENKLSEAQKQVEAMDKEQEALIDIISEERGRRDLEESSLRNKLMEASTTIQVLVDKVKLLEGTAAFTCKTER